MTETSLERLKRDHTELQNFLRRVERDGDVHKIPFIQEKLRYLVNTITRIEEEAEAKA